MAEIPTASTLHTLHRASGSATYISPQHPFTSSSITASTQPLVITSGINFPIELARRSDELPQSLFIDINVRPARGVGQVRERHVEELVKKILGAVILRRDWPRMGCQIGLQVLAGEEDEVGDRGSYLGLLCGCINASVMGCLDAAVPMGKLVGAVLVAVTKHRDVVVWPTMRERKGCRSLHVFAFSADGRLVLVESEGRFGMDEFEKVESVARPAVLGSKQMNGDVSMDEGEVKLGGGSVIEKLRSSLEARITRDERWKDG